MASIREGSRPRPGFHVGWLPVQTGRSTKRQNRGTGGWLNTDDRSPLAHVTIATSS
jgi:hypothetical protein